MKTTAVSVALLSLASTGLAQIYNQSNSFYLVLESADRELDGTALSACHEGAAIEGLCTGSKNIKGSSVFQFNTTSGEIVADKNLGPTGVLTYELQSSPPQSEGMQFYYDPSTNVALPLFEPTNTPTQVGFDKKNKLHIQSRLDDTVNPPTDEKVRGLYRWYVCKTNYAGYVYNTLSWIMGNGKPENPTCKKVDVVRELATPVGPN